MYKLKTNSINGHEESDFLTLEEAQAHFQNLVDSGYYGAECTHEIIEVIPKKDDISPRQIRMALLSLGLTESMIDTVILNLQSPLKEQAQIAWKYSLSYKRDETAVQAIGSLAGLSSEQLDSVWIMAKDL
jgi:hypothetical protein